MGVDEVLVDFDFAGDDLAPLQELEDRLASAITSAGVGELEGFEFAADGSNGSLAMYGPDADALFALARPLLAAAKFLRNVQVSRRYSTPRDGVRERLESLDA